MKKALTHILNGKDKRVSGDDAVIQSLPAAEFGFANPFVVVHHMGPKVLPSATAAEVFPHLHRGFAPVTFIVQGELSHKASAGHSGNLRAGDAQWRSGGKGLLPHELPPEQFLKRGGAQELLQLWINVPKANKWDAPAYQVVRKEQQPIVPAGEGVALRLVSGAYDSKAGPMKTHTPVIFMIGSIAKDRQANLHATPGFWTLLYIIKGEVTVNDRGVGMHHLIVFERDHDEISVIAQTDAQVLFMSAEPSTESVAATGNFAMNTPEEVKHARDHHKKEKFGAS